MKDNKEIKNKWLNIRLSAAEQEQLEKDLSKTNEKKLSRYARLVLLGKPIVVNYRDQSSDDLILEFGNLLKTINGIANNYNQTVHKLHTLDHIPQIKNWLDSNQNSGLEILEGIREIKSVMNKIGAKWLQ